MNKIKQKIHEHTDNFSSKIFVKPYYSFPKEIFPTELSLPIAKSLYEKEVKMNGFEERVATEISALENVLFWTKNVERKGFRLNGFINHYPDFIVVLKSGKILLLETKGNGRDNSDTEKKIKLGKL